MDSAVFEGKYLTRIGTTPESFPVPDETGFWFVWRTSIDSFLVQALNQKNLPVGELFSIDQMQLNELLLPASQKEEGLRSNAQDLLDVWYDHTYGEEIITSATQMAYDLMSEPESVFFLDIDTSEEKEELYGLTPSFRSTLQRELRKLEGKQESKSIKTLKRLIEGKEPLPEEGGVDWLLPTTFTELGLAFRREKHYELALLCHDRALILSPRDERILFNIARTKFEMGEQEESKKYLRQILSINPSFAVARDFLAFLEGSPPTIKK